MSIFPTQYSTLSSAALKVFLQKAYGFEIHSCKYLLRGVNDHYLIETIDDKFIFRIYRNTHRSLEEIESEVVFLNALREEGTSVSYPITTLNQEQIIAFDAAEGTRYGVLFSYAQGESINSMNDQQLTEFGTELARMHTISSTIVLPFDRRVYDMDTTIRQPIQSIKPIFEKDAENLAWINNTASKIIAKLDDFDFSEFSYGYCHYDLLPKNFHFDYNGRITFFDFDFLGKGLLVNDIMTFWLHLSLHATFNKISQEEADRQFNVVVSSYRKVRHLSDKEITAIPYLSFGFWIFFMDYHQKHFDDFSNPFFNSKYIKDRVGLIKKLTESYCKF